MRKVRLFVVLVGFFLGLCANTNCGPQERNHETKPVCKAGEITLCETGLAGDCSLGVRTCKGGQFTACQQTVTPEAESCDGRDNDCNGVADNGLTFANYFQDKDGDMFGNSTIMLHSCVVPVGYVADNTDCNDSDASVNPGAEEVCDGLDTNCNGLTDASCSSQLYSLAEFDGYKKGGRGYALLVTDNLISSGFYPYSYDARTGFITFDSQTINWDKVQALEVKVFFLNQTCDYGMPTFKVTLADTGNFYDWGGQNCSVDRTCGADGCQFSSYPEGCIMPCTFHDIKTWPLNLQAGSWYTSGESTDMVEAVINYLNKYEAARYFTFIIAVHCPTNIYLNNDGDVNFEDGGNVGGTGNLPTLTITSGE